MAEEKGWFSKVMGVIYYVLGIVKAWFSAKEREAENNEREEIIKNDAAKKTMNERNRAEDLMARLKAAKTQEEKVAILDEIRRRTSK